MFLSKSSFFFAMLSMLMCIQNLVKFCPLVLKILSGNEILTSIKGQNSVANFKKNDALQSQPIILSMLMCIQILVKFCPLVLKILSGNEILTSIKGCNSVVNLRNLTLYYPNLDIIYVNVYTKFG